MSSAVQDVQNRARHMPKADVFALIPLLVSVETAAQRAKVSGRWIRTLIQRDLVTAFKIADLNVVYWPSVEAYYQKRGRRLPRLVDNTG